MFSLCPRNSILLLLLDITFTGGKKLSVDIDVIKIKFYAACNLIFGKTYSLDEILRLCLLDSYCLPVLQYATAAIRLSKYQVLKLNVCCNSVFRKIFDLLSTNLFERLFLVCQGLISCTCV